MINTSIRLLIVDGHKLLRDGVSALVEQSGRIQIVGSVSTAEEAINIFPAVKPDILLMEIALEGMSGVEATRWVKSQGYGSKVILISAEVTKDLITAGIQSGIDGYLPKDIDASTLLHAIQSVANGKRFFHRAITQLIFEEQFINTTRVLKGVKASKCRGLTVRETEVLALVASGKRTRQVAYELVISVKTVETHKANILAKLGFRKTTELVHYAIKNKLIEIE